MMRTYRIWVTRHFFQEHDLPRSSTIGLSLSMPWHGKLPIAIFGNSALIGILIGVNRVSSRPLFPSVATKRLVGNKYVQSRASWSWLDLGSKWNFGHIAMSMKEESKDENNVKTWTTSCHCKAFVIEFDHSSPLEDARIYRCNCSFCLVDASITM